MTTTNPEPLLRIENMSTDIRLRKSTVHALDRVNLTVYRGETLGVVGESACGKTMTALSVMGLLPQGGSVVGGSILFDGRELTRLPEDKVRRVRGSEIGMIFQDPLTSLNPTMRIGVQVGEPLRVHKGASKAEARERAIETMRLVGMPRADKVVDDYPHQLSGGMRQRVAIAMALVCSPKLLIADEPTTALDVTTQRQILELIDDLRERLDMSVILVTHDLGVVAGRTDRVAVMYAGQVVETGTTREIFVDPRHRYTEALFEALPENAIHTKEALYSIPGMPPDLTKPPVGCRFAARCRFATDECLAEQPPLRGQTHQYSCFHPVDSAVARAAVRAAEAPIPAQATSTGAENTAGAVSQPNEDKPLLAVSHLVKDFPATAGTLFRHVVGQVSAVADVSFDVYEGETFGLVGESGCGKTTVGRLIVGLEQPTSGEIVVDGTNLAGLGRAARKYYHREVQLMFQDSYASMDPRMRVDDILNEPLVIQRVGSRAERRARVATLLDQVGLSPRVLERYPHEFSGGQLQRIGLARSLALQPKLIVGDEPVSALDVSIQAQMLNLMKELQAELGLGYVFISHDLSVVQYMARRIGVMYLGKLVEVGPADEVVGAPRHPYTRALIDAVPIADPNVQQRKSTDTIAGELPSALNPPTGCRFRTRCPLATELCATEPALVGDGGGHQVACHFPLVPATAGGVVATD